MSNKTILITGGAGFIGSNLTRKLKNKNYNVVVLDNLSTQIHGNDPENNSSLFKQIKNQCKFILGDIRDEKVWEDALKDVDIIIHLAAETGTGQSMYNIKQYVDVNCNGTAIMLDSIEKYKNKVKKIIVASSRAIYGEGKYASRKYGIVYPLTRDEDNLKNGKFEVTHLDEIENLEILPTDEDSLIHPTSMYGITKQNQEQMTLCYCSLKDKEGISLRFQNVYGPGQSLLNPYTGILSIFSNLIKNQEEINIFEDGLESRDFVYIDDVVDSIILVIESNKELKNKIYNVGTGERVTVLEVAKKLLEKYNSESSYYISGNFRLGDIRHNYADISKIKSELGFNPKVSFEEGIDKFVNWVNSQEVLKSNYSNSIEEMKQKGIMK